MSGRSSPRFQKKRLSLGRRFNDVDAVHLRKHDAFFGERFTVAAKVAHHTLAKRQRFTDINRVIAAVFKKIDAGPVRHHTGQEKNEKQKINRRGRDRRNRRRADAWH